MTREDLFELPPRLGRDVRYPLAWLAAITVLAAALRFHRLGSDLWLDEIATLLDYREGSWLDAFTVFQSLNNHPLNSLLVKASTAAFGPAEWAVRLPAAVFGILGIPAVYALARVALRHREALVAAFLLAVSYHHIFFSQNARGYTAMLSWALLATAVFFRALARDRARDWVLYAAALFLAAASVLQGLFVAAGHALAFLAACVVRAARGRRVWPLAGRAAVAWTATAAATLAAYASLLPKLDTLTAATYRTAAGGYAPFSLEHLREIVRGVAEGLGGPALLLALPAAVIGAFGLYLFAMRRVFFTCVLVAPLAATAGFLLARGFNFTPRFFLWAMPIVWIFVAGAAAALEERLAARAGMAAAAGALLWATAAGVAALSLVSLPAYYATPKQPNRVSLDWTLARRDADEPVVAAYMARWGLRFYGPAMALEDGKSSFEANTLADLEAIEAASRGRTIWLLTTFPRGLALERPDLDAHIRRLYKEQKRFPATVGDASVTVWSRRLPP